MILLLAWRRVAGLTVALALGLGPRLAAADESPTNSAYFVTPDALAFVYGSAAVAVLAFTLADPPANPRGFSSDEGGQPVRDGSIPDYQVGLLGVATLGAVASFDRPGRWYHAKGFAESFVTTAALAEVAKNSFGRHRPSYDSASGDEDDRKSFFSGHASLTWASTVYLGAYLHQHVFEPWRDGAFAWWEAPVFLGLGALSVYVPYTRLDENKHHLSDVLVGAAVGSALSVAFYTYQESRFARGHSTSRIAVAPWFGRDDGVGLQLTLGR